MKHEERKGRNDNSRNRAENHCQVWEEYELEVLRLWDGGDSSLDALSELLGRTREACRQMFYVDRRGASKPKRRVTITRTTTTTVTVYHFCPDCNLDPCCC